MKPMTDVMIFWRASFVVSMISVSWVSVRMGPKSGPDGAKPSSRSPTRPPTLAPGGTALTAFGPQAVSWETHPAGDEMGRFWVKPS